MARTSASSERQARRLLPPMTANRPPSAMPAIVNATSTSSRVKPRMRSLRFIELFSVVRGGNAAGDGIHSNQRGALVAAEGEQPAGAAALGKKGHFEFVDRFGVRIQLT